jgi:hypothetical protein
LLHAALEKFLRYRLLGKLDQGWQELRKDLNPDGDGYIYLGCISRQRGPDDKAIPVKTAATAIEHWLRNKLQGRYDLPFKPVPE